MADPSDFDITKREPPEGVLADLLLMILAAVGAIITLPGAAIAGQAELIRQRSLLDNLPTVNTPQEAAEAVHRGVIDDETFLTIMHRHGFTDSSAQLVKQISRPLLNIGELVALWLRAELSDDDIRSELSKHGFTPDRIDQILSLAYPVPAIQDQILFAVREVFDVVQAESLGQFEGVSEDAKAGFLAKFGGYGTGPVATTSAFEDFAKQAGLSPEWSTAYWAAHWQLPSPNQMFEMYQRRIIDRESLEVGIRSLDFSGYWREKLLGISYNPITRVDIRRMHALGLLDEDEIKLRYQDVGFSPDDADMLAQFTIAYNAPDDDNDTQELRDLTRSQILRFFRSGLFDEATTRDYLLSLNFSEDNTETIIALEYIAIADEATKTQIATIRARLKNGTIDFNAAVSQLDTLDLPSKERDYVLEQIEAERQRDIVLPGRSDLDRFLKLEVITIGVYVEEIERLGFPPPWPDRFASAILSEIEDRDKARLLSRSLVQKLYEQGSIDEDDAFARLLELNFSETDVRLLLDTPPGPLGRTVVQKLYKQKLITVESARERLLELNFSEGDVELLIASVSLADVDEEE